MLKNIACERALLAGLCQYASEAYIDCVDLLRPEIFTDTKNSLIFLTLSSLLKNNRKEIDIASLYSEATALNYYKMICEQKEDKEYIQALFNYSISCSNVRDQAAILYKLFVARSLQESSQRVFKELSEIKGTEGLDSILSIPENGLTSTINSLSYEDDLQPIGQFVDEYLKYLSDNPSENIGIPTPFSIYNRVVGGGGLRPGVSIICARLKTGKSSFGTNTAIHCAMNNIPTLIVDLEMSWEEQLHRMIANLSKVNIRKIETGSYTKNPSEKKNVQIAVENLKNIPLVHKRISGKNFSDVISLIKRWIHKVVGVDISGKTNPHLVVYDYFKMFNTNDLKNMREYEVLGYQIAELHDLCKTYNTPCLAFCQTNRDGITGENSSVVAQSDRLGWGAISLSLFKRKTADEIGEDGINNGNVKLIPLEGRFMEKLNDGDYINMNLDGGTCYLKELGTKYGSKDFRVE